MSLANTNCLLIIEPNVTVVTVDSFLELEDLFFNYILQLIIKRIKMDKDLKEAKRWGFGLPIYCYVTNSIIHLSVHEVYAAPLGQYINIPQHCACKSNNCNHVSCGDHWYVYIRKCLHVYIYIYIHMKLWPSSSPRSACFSPSNSSIFFQAWPSYHESERNQGKSQQPIGSTCGMFTYL